MAEFNVPQLTKVNGSWEGGMYVDTSDLVSGFFRFADVTRSVIESYLKYQCEELEKYMKRPDVAKWNDRTGDARRGLKAEFEEKFGPNAKFPTMMTIKLSHTVYYGRFLEQAMERRFAVLEPTARLKGPDILDGMKGIIDDMGWKRK